MREVALSQFFMWSRRRGPDVVVVLMFQFQIRAFFVEFPFAGFSFCAERGVAFDAATVTLTYHCPPSTHAGFLSFVSLHFCRLHE